MSFPKDTEFGPDGKPIKPAGQRTGEPSKKPGQCDPEGVLPWWVWASLTLFVAAFAVAVWLEGR